MPNDVIELYGPSADAGTLRGVADRLAAGARHLSGQGTLVRYIDTIFLPGDETACTCSRPDPKRTFGPSPVCPASDVDRVVPAEQIAPLAQPHHSEEES